MLRWTVVFAFQDHYLEWHLVGNSAMLPMKWFVDVPELCWVSKHISFFLSESCWALGIYRIIRFWVIKSCHRVSACFYLIHRKTHLCSELISTISRLPCPTSLSMFYVEFLLGCKSSPKWKETMKILYLSCLLSFGKLLLPDYCIQLTYSLPRQSWHFTM